jgi:hypothetical protein
MLAPAQLHRCGHEPKATAPSAPKSMPTSSKRYATTGEITNGTINLITNFTPKNTGKNFSDHQAQTAHSHAPASLLFATFPGGPRSSPVSGSALQGLLTWGQLEITKSTSMSAVTST